MMNLLVLGQLVSALVITPEQMAKIDWTNPYKEPVAIDEARYQSARLGIAGACQDLKFQASKATPNVLNDPDYKEVLDLLDQCDPNYIEYYTLHTWAQDGEEITDCPIVELLELNHQLLRVVVDSIHSRRMEYYKDHAK